MHRFRRVLRIVWCFVVGCDYKVVQGGKNNLHLECARCKRGWIGGPDGSITRKGADTEWP